MVKVLNIFLRECISNDMPLVDEVSFLDASIRGTLQVKLSILEQNLSLARVGEAEAPESHTSGSIDSDESWRSIDDVRIVEAKCGVVVGIVEAVEGDLDGQHIGFRVHRDPAADCTVGHQLCRLEDGVVRRGSEADLDFFAGWILADEVSA